MPKVVKEAIPHILISMFIAPIMLGLFAWAGATIIDNKIEIKGVKHVNNSLNDIKESLSYMTAKQNKMYDLIHTNHEDIAIIKHDNYRR